MKHSFRIFSALVAMVLLSLIHSTASAQTQPTISYQGVLQTNGAPVNGPMTLKILIYNVQTGGSPIYSETQNVNVANGIFNVAIGSVTPLLPSLDFTKQYYLTVSVNDSPEFSPRSEVSFAPYAFRALNADTASYSSTAARATVANTVSGGVVSSVNGLNGGLLVTGTNGITVTNNNPPNIIIGSTGVQSVNTAGGKITLVGSGGTTIADTGTTITIHSATFTGGTGVQAVQNADSVIAITNGSGPIATINLAQQKATSGQVLAWNGSGWRPASAAFTGIQNTDSTITITNPNGPIATIGLGKQNATAGQVLEWNGSAWRPTTPSSLSNNTNTAYGYQALLHIDSITVIDNSAFGYYALKNNIGIENSAFGWETMWGPQGPNSGSGNSAFGWGALPGNLTGNGNTAIGSGTMADNDSGSFNVAVGNDALFQDRGRSHLVAIGDSALRNNGYSFTLNARATLDSATANTAVGSMALLVNSTGAYNTATGYQALYLNNTGYRNTALGYTALNQNVTGNDNTAIGDSTGPSSGNLNNTTTLGSGAQATASNEVVLGNANVNLLYCQGAYAATTAASANMVVASNGQIMRSTSSARYKTDIHDLDINTDKLYDLRPVSYTSKIDGKEYFGLIAEDVAKVIPDLAEYARSKDVIPGSKSDVLIPDAVKYPMLSVLLLEELKKEHARAESEEKQVESQTKIIADMERRLEAVEVSQKAAR
jgi:hypothetical protein